MRDRFFALIKELTLGGRPDFPFLDDLRFQQTQKMRTARNVCRNDRLLVRNHRMPEPRRQFNRYGGLPERKHTMPHRPIQNQRDDPAMHDSRIRSISELFFHLSEPLESASPMIT